jgi:MFS family permease
VAADCWRVSASRPGRLALLLFLLPIGAGGASSIFAAIAGSWGASASVLSDAAWISGVLTSITAIAGGFVCDRMDRKLAYVLFGLVVGVIAAGMAVFPHTPTWFLVFVFAYSAATGLAYAGFAAVTLETIGAGAAATKYNLFASVSNAPVAVMPAVDGWVVTRYGAPSMLWLELAVAVASAVVYLAALAVMRRPRAATAT